MVIKRALLVTDRIPDKGDFHSQVYRGIPAGPAVPAVDQRPTTIDGTGDQYPARGAISRSAPSALVIWELI
jgi:hypothetical protein